jgi:hypothetical protein
MTPEKWLELSKTREQKRFGTIVANGKIGESNKEGSYSPSKTLIANPMYM